MKHWITVLTLLMGMSVQGWTQESLPPGQFGVRAGYSLELPSISTFRGEDFAFFEAGHRLSYGAFFNVPVDKNVQFVPYFGLEHIFWPKNLGYSQDCALDSFPTFWGVADTLPGRDIRLYNISVEPGFRFFLPRISLHFKTQLHLTYTIRARVEDYNHTCDAPLSQGWLAYEPNPNRSMNAFNLAWGFGFVKEVELGKGAFLSLEPGFRTHFSPVFKVFDPDPNGPFFSLYPRAFYLNLGFAR